ncbi:unnamed protein product, partial [Ectocarpus sp. 12 AP-2014]
LACLQRWDGGAIRAIREPEAGWSSSSRVLCQLRYRIGRSGGAVFSSKPPFQVSIANDTGDVSDRDGMYARSGEGTMHITEKRHVEEGHHAQKHVKQGSPSR